MSQPILQTTFWKRCTLEGDSLCAVLMSCWSMTQALEVGVYTTFSLCRKFQINLDLSWILVDFTALTGQIIRKAPQRPQKNTTTTLTVKAKGGCEFRIRRNAGGGLYWWSHHLLLTYLSVRTRSWISFQREFQKLRQQQREPRKLILCRSHFSKQLSHYLKLFNLPVRVELSFKWISNYST